MDKVNEPLLIIPEEHNIALKFRDDRLSSDHADLVRRSDSPCKPLFKETAAYYDQGRKSDVGLDRDDKDESTNGHTRSLHENLRQRSTREGRFAFPR